MNFDRVADKYDNTRGLPPGVPEQIADWVLNRLPADPVITELGVGTGRIALPFIQRGVRYTGFDVSEQMTERLKAKLDGDLRRAQVVLADITQPLPLPEASQDAVIAVHILHLVDPVATLTQVRRILKPGGALVWGYEWSDDQSPHVKLRKHFQAEMESKGHKRSDFRVPAARRLLAEWGAAHEAVRVATWGRSETLRQHLDRLRGRVYSSTWSADDEALQAAADRTEAWARAEYGDLDQVLPDEKWFMVDWYELGGAKP